MTTHDVKSWTHFFQAILAGEKTHDLRLNDRDYKVGDVLRLHEYDNINGKFTGVYTEAEVTYITDSRVPCAFSSAVLPKDYSILSLKVLK